MTQAQDQDQEQDQIRQLTDGLRLTQLALDASRHAAMERKSERRQLARRIDLLSHLLLSYRDTPALDVEAGERAARTRE